MQLYRTTILSALLIWGGATFARAHDYWSDGHVPPDWIKKSCCGPADAHHLHPEQVHRISEDYYEVDGYSRRIPVGQAIPSQDGEYWIFYKDDVKGSDGKSAGQSGVYCFFVPMAF